MYIDNEWMDWMSIVMEFIFICTVIFGFDFKGCGEVWGRIGSEGWKEGK
jgi:hypothetical protein